MRALLQRLLFKLLGPARYLQWTSRAFFVAYDRGRLRTDPTYYAHYYVPNLVRPGDTVIDIGANLGYYSVLLARLVGERGRVYSVEPVPLFREVLRRNTAKFSQVEILPYALGSSRGQVRLGTPVSAGKFRHGLTHVIADEAPGADFSHTFEAEMRVPAELFGALQRLDFIKMDVEGYEKIILPELLPLIRRYRPVLQIETPANDRPHIFQLLQGEAYAIFYVAADGLRPVSEPEQPTGGDLIYLPIEMSMPAVAAGSA